MLSYHDISVLREQSALVDYFVAPCEYGFPPLSLSLSILSSFLLIFSTAF